MADNDHRHNHIHSRDKPMKHLSCRLTAVLVFFFLVSALPAFSGTRNLGYQRMADNFFIIYDPSTDMDLPYKESGLTRMAMEKKIIRESAASLPELNWQAGLYPHWKGGLWLAGSPEAFAPFYRLHNFDKKKYIRAIDRLPTKPAGPPMLQIALMKLEHLLGIAGRTQVFLFSDGKDSRLQGVPEPAPLTQTKKLAKNYDVCFTIISNATGKKEKKLLADMAAVNSCSQVIDFDTVAAHPEHLLGKLYLDGRKNFSTILFDFDRYNIKKEYRPILNKLGRILHNNPLPYVVLSGFTDNIGSEAYNIKLSEKRTKSVVRYLQNKFHIDAKRLLPYWYGYARPVADNSTPEGRRSNRRVTVTLRNN